MFYISDVNPTALRKAKIVYNFGLSECNRVKLCTDMLPKKHDVFSIMQFPNNDIYHTERKDCFQENSIIYGLTEDHPWKNGCLMQRFLVLSRYQMRKETVENQLMHFVSVPNEKGNCRGPANAALTAWSYSVIRSTLVRFSNLACFGPF